MTIMIVRTPFVSAHQKFEYRYDNAIIRAAGTSSLAQANTPNVSTV